MKKTLYLVMVIAVFAVISVPAFAQDVVYVQSIKAKIMTQPSFKSTLLGEAAKGSRLLSTGREGSWVKVTINQKEGYVSSLLLSKFPPTGKAEHY